jgi:AraC-like DNA-binding protein
MRDRLDCTPPARLIQGEAMTAYETLSDFQSRSGDTGLPSLRAEAVDPLGVIISLLRPKTVLSKIVSGSGTWSIRKPKYADPAFAVILDGSCFLDPDGVGPVELKAGDFVLLPEMPSFTLASDLDIDPVLIPLSDSRDIRYGVQSGPPTMRLLGGYFRFDRANAPLLVTLLPPFVHVRRDDTGAERLRRIVALIAEEADVQRPGRDLILERLVEVLIVESLRFRLERAARQEHGLLGGLADPALARALRAFHFDVARRWTVAELARMACMSRAVFAERFTQKVGMPPMQYVLEWRMAIAKDTLRRDSYSLTEVADRVGYQSSSAFSAAFTRLTGCPPKVFARSAG